MVEKMCVNNSSQRRVMQSSLYSRKTSVSACEARETWQRSSLRRDDKKGEALSGSSGSVVEKLRIGQSSRSTKPP